MHDRLRYGLLCSVAGGLSLSLVVYLYSPRGDDSLDRDELEALLAEISERMSNGSMTSIDSAGLAFVAGDDGRYDADRVQTVRIVLFDRVVLPADKIRFLMDRGSRPSEIYHEARQGIHTAPQGFIFLGDKGFALRSIQVHAGSEAMAELVSTAEDGSERVGVGSLHLALLQPGQLAGSPEGWIQLNIDGVEQIHQFYLFSERIDTSVVLRELGGSRPNSTELRQMIFDAILGLTS